jgi:hypothetical protein
MTESDFVATVLENIGILASGQTVTAEDRDIVVRRMTSVFAQLAGEDLYEVADPENIEDSVALLLADIVSHACATPYGIQGGKLAELAAGAQAARDGIKLVTRERPHRDTLTVPRFWGRRRGGWDGTY